MVLGSELGLISSGKAKKNLAKKKHGGPPCQLAAMRVAYDVAAFVCGASCGARRGKPPHTANPMARGVADRHAFFKKIVDCMAVRHAVL